MHDVFAIHESTSLYRTTIIASLGTLSLRLHHINKDLSVPSGIVSELETPTRLSSTIKGFSLYRRYTQWLD